MKHQKMYAYIQQKYIKLFCNNIYDNTVNYTQTIRMFILDKFEHFNCLSVINWIIMNFYQTNKPLQKYKNT